MSAGRPVALGLALALAGCVGPAGDVAPPPQAAALPHGAFVLASDRAASMLEQCSRSVPAAGEAGWTPGAADIGALEALLPARLSDKRPDRDWSGFPDRWIRQYVGIVRGGRRYIYGNFVPADVADEAPGADREAIIICDGGPAFFGAEYDVSARAITHLAFNGRA